MEFDVLRPGPDDAALSCRGDGFMAGGALAARCDLKAANLHLGELECASGAVWSEDNLSRMHSYLMML